MANECIEEVIPVIKSENDDREYKFIILKNKLKVLLVSDPSSEKSAACLNVHVGHSSDPDAVPGIAHFCEHMLFLGNEKYPEEGEYNKFLSQNGGYSNASTSGEHTVYFFDVKSEALLPALDRFAQFFRSPLFNSDATGRELHAVDSEHQKNVLNDSRRKYFISKSTAKYGHVFQKFGTGNLETLKSVPEEKGIDIREVLLDFHSNHYSPNIMTLAVLGKESLDELERNCVDLFKDIPNKEVSIPSYEEYPYGDDELRVVVKIPTIKEMKCLQLTFMMPDFQEEYKSKPLRYASHLIGHEGAGSLLSLLKKELLVNTLGCGSHRVLKGFEFFTISMNLTDKGLDRVFDVIEICFQYINMLKKEAPQLWIYNEIQMLDEIKFRFKNKVPPCGYVNSLARSMHFYLPEDVLYGGYRMDTFAPDQITRVLDNLNPSNFRCYVQSQTFEGKTDKTVKYYDAGYSIEKIPTELIERWTNIGLHPDLHLPKENLFIPKNLDILVSREEKESKSVPTLIRDTKTVRMWYKPDDTFFLPKAYIQLHISSPHSFQTPSHLNNLAMYIRLIKDSLIEFAYDAELAGIAYYVNRTNRGFFINISGFNSCQIVLLKKILDQVINLKIMDERFDVNKVQLEENLNNLAKDEPYVQMGRLKSHLLNEKAWTAEERLEYMNDLSVQSLEMFIPEFLKCIYVEGLLCGNMLKTDVEEICSIVEKVLIDDNHARAMLAAHHLLTREFKLPKGSNYLYEERSEIHSNTCIQVYLQVGLQEEHCNVLCELFSHMIHAPLFDSLRTKEQLGYIVFSGVSRSYSVQGFRVLIQTDKSIVCVYDIIEKFLATFNEVMDSMTDLQFEEYVEGLAVKKLEKPKNLHAEANKYWGEINCKQYHYLRSECEVKALRNLTKTDVMEFFKSHISPASKDRRKIVFVILGKDAVSLGGEDTSWEVIDDVLKFKSGLSIYPLVTPYNDIPLMSSASKL